MTGTTESNTTMDATQLDAMLASIEELPSIPETLIEILKIIDDPDSSPSDLADVVRLDAPLMAKILRLANSPYYSSRGDLSDINRCVSVLGYRTVRQVAICVTVATSLVSAVSRAQGRLDYRELWRHSVVTGAIAKHLARIVGYQDPEEIFTAGLLHDMGKFVLEIYAPEAYDRAILMRSESQCRLVDIETETFGCDHTTIGGAFARSWRFPELMATCFESHHIEMTPEKAVDRSAHAAALVALADYLANTMEPSRSDLGFDPRLCNPVALHSAADIPVKTIEDNLSSIRDEIIRASAFLDMG